MLKEGETDVKPRRGGISLSRRLRTFFQMDFENQECNHTKDGTVVICPKVHHLVGKYLHFLGRHSDDAWRFKLNLDYGGDSLKVLLQILFDDDPLKTHDFQKLMHLNDARDGNFDLLQSGVNGVWLFWSRGSFGISRGRTGFLGSLIFGHFQDQGPIEGTLLINLWNLIHCGSFCSLWEVSNVLKFFSINSLDRKTQSPKAQRRLFEDYR